MRTYRPPAVQSRQRCLIEGCERPEELANGRPAGGLCAAHRKRKVRGQPIESPILERHIGHKRQRMRTVLIEAALALADAEAESEAAFHRAESRLMKRIWLFARAFRRRRRRGSPSTR